MDLQDPTPDLLISAYTRGVFPMADARTGELVWLSPDPRAILPLDELRVSRSLARVVRSGRFEIRTDTAFELVMRACAESRPDRDETWIDDRLIRAYTALHALGLAHSVEAWREGELVGGLYGVQVGAAFCGESRRSVHDASSRAARLCGDLARGLPGATGSRPASLGRLACTRRSTSPWRNRCVGAPQAGAALAHSWPEGTWLSSSDWTIAGRHWRVPTRT
jgi:leucyl/phenylalanyl-tRNA--protein transferase